MDCLRVWLENFRQNPDGRITYIAFWFFIVLGIIKEKYPVAFVRYRQRVIGKTIINESGEDGEWLKEAVIKVCAITLPLIVFLGYRFISQGETITFLRVLWAIVCGAVWAILHNKPNQIGHLFEWVILVFLTPFSVVMFWGTSELFDVFMVIFSYAVFTFFRAKEFSLSIVILLLGVNIIFIRQRFFAREELIDNLLFAFGTSFVVSGFMGLFTHIEKIRQKSQKRKRAMVCLLKYIENTCKEIHNSIYGENHDFFYVNYDNLAQGFKNCSKSETPQRFITYNIIESIANLNEELQLLCANKNILLMEEIMNVDEMEAIIEFADYISKVLKRKKASIVFNFFDELDVLADSNIDIKRYVFCFGKDILRPRFGAFGWEYK